jgi:hypothetical protein
MGKRIRDSDIIAQDVLAIVYRHREDGEFYAHGFGGRDPKIITLRGGEGITLKGLAQKSDVLAIAERDGSVHLVHSDGLRIWGEY